MNQEKSAFEEAIKVVGEATERIHGINPYEAKKAVALDMGLTEDEAEQAVADDEDKAENMNPDGDVFAQEIEAEIDLQEE